MGKLEEQIESYQKQITNAQSMTDLLLVMSSWQTFADTRGLTEEQRKPVDEAYLRSEALLITKVSKSPW